MSARPHNRFEPVAAAPKAFGAAAAVRSIGNRTAFTILELLVVITIIGILAAIGLPAIRGMTKSNALVAADRQLLDDLGYARLRAIADHTTVFVVFVPTNIADVNAFPPPSPTNIVANNVLSNLLSRQYTTYALISLRSVGDQPGTHTPHYLTDWRTLPNGVYIATNKFGPLANVAAANLAPPFFGTSQLDQPNTQVQFPFPTDNSTAQNSTRPGKAVYCLPYIAFNYQGQLCFRTNRVNGQDLPVLAGGGRYEQYFPLARGSIFYTRDANGNLTTDPPDVQENPPGNAYYTYYTNGYTGQPLPGADAGKVYNQIHVDPLTGRPHVETLQVQ
ncbi:MAG TPA: prepilin-type N-terminal cleavage/methylation domain-containing protein [Verrucomicrobiae bacterium]|nr:prepilin-type N-terminal cleavage/methylation domain-containing protein [Verrucomicrobiae bacterium]